MVSTLSLRSPLVLWTAGRCNSSASSGVFWQNDLFLESLKPSSSSVITICYYTAPSTASCILPRIIESDPVSDFLVKQCGFSSQQISLLQKRCPSLWRVKSIKRARQATGLLINYGFTERQLRKLILQYPPVLTYRAEETLRTRLELIKSLGFAGEELGDVVSRGPRVLGVKQLARNIEHLQVFFGGTENLQEAVKKLPQLLTCDPEKAQKQIDFLKQSHLQEHVIFHLIARNPSVLLMPQEEMKARIDYLRNLGVSESTRSFVTALGHITRTGRNLDERAKALASGGLKEEEIREIFRKWPFALAKSPQKLQTVMNYLVSTAGLSPEVIVKYPEILGFSLENRIRPRHEAFKFLVSSGHYGKLRSLGRFIKLSDKRFFKGYVERNPNKHRLLEIYRAALRHHNKQSCGCPP